MAAGDAADVLRRILGHPARDAARALPVAHQHLDQVAAAYRALFLAPPSFGAKVSVPTRFVWSTGDTALTRQSTLHAQAEVTGPYEFVELPGVSHWIPDEVPEQLAEIVATHAKNHPA